MKMYCNSCEMEMDAVSIGWMCPKCKDFKDMQGVTHHHVDRPFMPPQTNGDYLRSLPDGELAEALIDIVYELFEDGVPAAEFVECWLRRLREEV